MMEDCEFQKRLSAYHDNEVDAVTADRVTRHLCECDSCRTQLAEIRELSELASLIGTEGIRPAALIRIHRAIEADGRRAIFRIASVLTGVAASAMVIGSAWLWETPGPRPVPGHLMVRINKGDSWESVAVNLRADPLTRAGWEMRDPQMLADVRFSQWMVEGLSRSGQ